jgi:hypothetical protein
MRQLFPLSAKTSEKGSFLAVFPRPVTRDFKKFGIAEFKNTPRIRFVSFVPVRRPDGVAPCIRRRRTLRSDWAQRTACCCRCCVQAARFPARMPVQTAFSCL